MFFNTKQLSVQRVSPSAFLEIGVETSIAYYIIDPGLPLVVNSLEYKVDTQSGRDATNVIPWTIKDVSGVTDDTYQFDILLPIADTTLSSVLKLSIKVTDVDGMEYYYIDTEVSPI